jgi:hypothetical protein
MCLFAILAGLTGMRQDTMLERTCSMADLKPTRLAGSIEPWSAEPTSAGQMANPKPRRGKKS